MTIKKWEGYNQTHENYREKRVRRRAAPFESLQYAEPERDDSHDVPLEAKIISPPAWVRMGKNGVEETESHCNRKGRN